MAWPTLRADWSSGEVLTAADLNTHNDALQTLEDATSFTPTWTSDGDAPSYGNASVIGYWMEAGNWMDVLVHITFGSTTNFGTGNYAWTIPNSRSAVANLGFGMGWVIDTGTGANKEFVICRSVGSTSLLLSTEKDGNIAATVPFTFVNTDEIFFNARIFLS